MSRTHNESRADVASLPALIWTAPLSRLARLAGDVEPLLAEVEALTDERDALAATVQLAREVQKSMTESPMEIVRAWGNLDLARALDGLQEATEPYNDTPIHLPAAMIRAGLSVSTAQARREIDAGVVSVDGEPVPAGQHDIVLQGAFGTVKVGKHRSARVAVPTVQPETGGKR